jgi:hypothetical protein
MVRECEHNRNNVQQIQINQINLTDQIETMSTLPEYTIDEIKQLQSSDNVLSVDLNFVEQGKPTTQVLAKQTKPVKKLLRKFDSLLIDNGILYRTISDIECGGRTFGNVFLATKQRSHVVLHCFTSFTMPDQYQRFYNSANVRSVPWCPDRLCSV